MLILDFQTPEETEQKANGRKKSECAMQAGSEATEIHSRSIFLRPKKKETHDRQNNIPVVQGVALPGIYFIT